MADLNHGLAVLIDDLERPVLHVPLDILVIPSPTDQPLGVEYSVDGVLRSLVLRSITDETFVLGESDP